MKTLGRTGMVWMVAWMVLAACGCRSATVAQPLTAELAGNHPATQMEFWHTLAERPVVSNDEAFHGLLLFLDGRSDAQTYEQRVSQLLERQMLPSNFDRPAHHAVRRGDLAVAISRMLEIRGGVMMSLFGPSPRYATRELEYRNIFPRSSPQQTFSGAQFMALIGRVEDMERILGIQAGGAELRQDDEADDQAG